MTKVYLGGDWGGTTTKYAAVDEQGVPLSNEVFQLPSSANAGPQAAVAELVNSASEYLATLGFAWTDVAGVGLAVPGTLKGEGVLDTLPNLPKSFNGVDIKSMLEEAIERANRRKIPVSVGNDGNLGGLAEASYYAQGGSTAVCLFQGTGLGGAYIGKDGLPLIGDQYAGAEFGHMYAPVHLLGLDVLSCNCGRDWGCVEAYTSITGLPHLVRHVLQAHPNHPYAANSTVTREQVLQLRTLAQSDDPLALDVFGLQARVIGLFVANLLMAVDASVVVIGGGLMDSYATTERFREWYLETIETTAKPILWPRQRTGIRVCPAALGENSQAVGAALLANRQVHAS